VLIWCFGPGVVLLFHRERYRRMKFHEQLCLSCGYDLRGTVAAGRTSCPECGKPIAPPDAQ
jgi:ribosomal protein S27AE